MSTAGTCDVERVTADTAEFVYRGHVAVADLHVMVKVYKDLRAERGPERFNLVDALAVTGVARNRLTQTLLLARLD